MDERDEKQRRITHSLYIFSYNRCCDDEWRWDDEEVERENQWMNSFFLLRMYKPYKKLNGSSTLFTASKSRLLRINLKGN